MGMSAFGLMRLLCLLSVCILAKSASILEKSGDLWQNWLLNENEEAPSQQSPPLSRRITPKSVFIAPAFSRCSEGYMLNANGNCVRRVMISEAAQWELVLERLRVVSAQLGFDKKQSQRNDNNNDEDSVEKHDHNKKPDAYAFTVDKDNTGPFQLSIPIIHNKNSFAENQFNLLDATSISSTSTTTSSSEKSHDVFATTTEHPNPGTQTQTQSTPRMADSTSRLNTYSLDYTSTQEYTTMPDTVTPPSGTDDDSQFTVAESIDMETTTVSTVDSTTEESMLESTFNTASHFCPDCGEVETTDATEISTTPIVVRRVPNYGSILPLKSVGVVDKNVERVSTGYQGVTTDSKPLSSYVSAKIDDKLNNTSSLAHSTTNPTTHDVNIFNGDRQDGEDVIGDSSNLFQRLPSNERSKSKCDPLQYNCFLQFNTLPTDKPLNRKPSTAFVRFPETLTKSYVRFPQQKPYQDDLESYAEGNPGFAAWNVIRYPTWNTGGLWSKSKQPPPIRIGLQNSIYSVGPGGVNYIRSHPYFQTHTEWYSTNTQ